LKISKLSHIKPWISTLDNNLGIWKNCWTRPWSWSEVHFCAESWTIMFLADFDFFFYAWIWYMDLGFLYSNFCNCCLCIVGASICLWKILIRLKDVWRGSCNIEFCLCFMPNIISPAISIRCWIWCVGGCLISTCWLLIPKGLGVQWGVEFDALVDV
jgi:hypothetical protein